MQGRHWAKRTAAAQEIECGRPCHVGVFAPARLNGSQVHLPSYEGRSRAQEERSSTVRRIVDAPSNTGLDHQGQCHGSGAFRPAQAIRQTFRRRAALSYARRWAAAARPGCRSRSSSRSWSAAKNPATESGPGVSGAAEVMYGGSTREPRPIGAPTRLWLRDRRPRSGGRRQESGCLPGGRGSRGHGARERSMHSTVAPARQRAAQPAPRPSSPRFLPSGYEGDRCGRAIAAQDPRAPAACRSVPGRGPGSGEVRHEPPRERMVCRSHASHVPGFPGGCLAVRKELRQYERSWASAERSTLMATIRWCFRSPPRNTTAIPPRSISPVMDGVGDRQFEPRVGPLLMRELIPIIGGGGTMLTLVHVANVPEGAVLAAIANSLPRRARRVRCPGRSASGDGPGRSGSARAGDVRDAHPQQPVHFAKSAGGAALEPLHPPGRGNTRSIPLVASHATTTQRKELTGWTPHGSGSVTSRCRPR